MRNQHTQLAEPTEYSRRKRKALGRFILSGFVIASVGFTGCKTASNMPGAGFLGLKKTPSAETLAGQGPSVTYPPTPGTNYNPTAIVSKSAGTGTTPDIDAGSVPGNAAVANGYASTTKPGPTTGTGTGPTTGTATGTTPSYVTNGWGGSSGANASATPPPPTGSTPSTPPSFANNTFAPPPASSPMNMPPNMSGNNSPANSFAGNASSYTMPGNASIPNYGPSNYAQPPAPNGYANIDIPGSAYQVATTSGATGYGGTTNNPYATPAVNPPAQPTPSMPTQVAGGFTIPSLGGPTAGDASSGDASSGAGSTSGGSNQGYRPGSTAGATSYPNTPYTAPNGSMFR